MTGLRYPHYLKSYPSLRMADLIQKLALELPGRICSGNFEIQTGQGIINHPLNVLSGPLQIYYSPAAGTNLTGGQNLFIDTSQASIHLAW